ncbi:MULTISPECIES: flagellar hook-associated protein FlgK [unclassified Bradyrhizobium]|uniref:flagellar hook-associated protein FlgK n=1 Tax=unclassified Bradyrhizobium TaxID=2631580 RepID=UPI00247A413F|nr:MULTISPECIES: flagellar hook-associated protein FlgK [unclassified Bradyrhizobium]WGS22944.1 flagellar hook-associated protein FlgK [Bradyrhizobium sp. ISRA463]WGS29944.1 flagellar hook-associated protein FlgK [Bradyrhizobium sp. ISRA464]
MGLSQALSTAMSGLRATQASLSLVSSNVANSETPGYTKKTLNQVAGTTGDYGSSVLISGVNRQLDEFLQTQLRTETSGASYADIRSTYLANLQSVYGNPDSTGTIEDTFNKLLTAIQGLSTSPDSQSARIGVVNAAQAMAQQLNATSQGIQTLRANAEAGINDSVNTANNALTQIARINVQLQAGGQTDASTAALLDQRDQYITQLSQLMDIRTVTNSQNQVTVFTNSGVQLVGTEAAQLSFNAQGTMTPNALYNSDPTKSTVGTISITFPHGGSYDLVSTNSIRSGKIAAYLELRDNTLVKAQAQIDQFAASMASALSDKTTAGTAASAGAQSGYDLDLSGLQSGNVIHVSYKDNTTGATHNLSIVRVDDPSVLPLSNTATVDPNDEVLGIDFSGGMSSVLSQLNGALGATAGLQFSNPSGSTLRVLDDGAANRSDVTAASVTTTVTSLTSGDPQLPLFTDNGAPYTGAITGSGSQMTGLAARISVNSSLVGDPSRTVVFSTNPPTAAGDTTRANLLLSQLSMASYSYSPQTGLGTNSAPLTGTLVSFARQFISQQGEAATAAKQLSDGQDVVLNTLQSKMNATSGVNIDDEMAHLLALQNAYSANARVMSSIKQMYDTLMQAM